jgi:hypothetical protein
MIYDFPPIDAPIRQGDIFIGLPRIDMSLQEVPVIEADGEQTIRSWAEISEEGSPVTAILAVRPVAAIVATQDCDAVRAPDITLLNDNELKAYLHDYPDAKPFLWQTT